MKAGVCPHCHSRPRATGRSLCERCAIRKNEQTKARAAKLVASGRCRCGREPVAGTKRCRGCLANASPWRVRQYANGGWPLPGDRVRFRIAGQVRVETVGTVHHFAGKTEVRIKGATFDPLDLHLVERAS